MDVFGYLVQRQLQAQITDTRADTRHAEQVAMELEARVRILEHTNRALWSLIKEKTGWTDEELIQQAKAAEAVQGPDHCPSCGRRLLVRNGSNCSWCGQSLAGNLPIGRSPVPPQSNP